MRKTAAILLLSIFVFNTVGYKLWFYAAMQKADHQLETAIDQQQYNPEDLFTLKVPLNLPYQNIDKNYERVDGEISLNGTLYRYVQRKVCNDTMYLQCIPHHEKTALAQKSGDYFGKTNGYATDHADSKAPQKAGLEKFAQPDFIAVLNYVPEINYPVNAVATFHSKYHQYTASAFLNKLIKPPQMA